MTFREKLPDLLADPEVRGGYDAKRAERELPDFQSAPAWLNCYRVTWTASEAYPEALLDPEFMRSRAPWTPLDTAEAWVKRIRYQRLLSVVDQADDDPRAITDAVLAALPELMGGEQA